VLDFTDILISGFLFISLFLEVFLLLTFLEHKNKLKTINQIDQNQYPTATIIVPCFNEENSILGTIESLLRLDYPADKFKIMIIDDGSTDNSWNIIQKYNSHPIIDIFHKENGGKHTALNFAISHSTSDIIGCLDADSFVAPDALKKIVQHFADPEVMAVVPTIKIHEPSRALEKVQKVQYEWGVFMRKTLSFLNALYVTPGPFSFFRRSVFEKIGPYRKAHNTEDCEIALRMQKNHLRIANCHEAYIYTVAPKKLYALYRQQLRWVYGTLKNMIDYRELFLKKEYSNLGFLILPVVLISAVSVLFITTIFLFNTSNKLSQIIQNWRSINFDLSWPQIDWSGMILKADYHVVLGLITFSIVLTIIFIGKRLAGEKIRTSSDLFYFFVIFPVISPFWLFRAFYNIIASQKTTWR
jgi:cellulose synthase/poly-beta-1,6-N-acetylglucosamine synthase-like glycosyltransferase